MQRAGHSSPCTRANKCQSFSSNHFNWRLIWQMSNIPMHYLYQWLFSYIGGPCPVLYKTCLLFLFLLSVLTIFCHQASWTMWYERLSRLTTKEVLARSNGECWWGKLQNNQRKRIWQKLRMEEKEIFFWELHQFFTRAGGRQSLDEDGLGVHQDARALCRGDHQ